MKPTNAASEPRRDYCGCDGLWPGRPCPIHDAPTPPAARCVCAEINTRHCPVHGQGEAEAAATRPGHDAECEIDSGAVGYDGIYCDCAEREYERRMTCPRCGQYGDGCNCDAATRSF